MRYIELNPVRAGLSAVPADYRWSSYAHHIGRLIDPLIKITRCFGRSQHAFERQLAYQRLFDVAVRWIS